MRLGPDFKCVKCACMDVSVTLLCNHHLHFILLVSLFKYFISITECLLHVLDAVYTQKKEWNVNDSSHLFLYLNDFFLVEVKYLCSAKFICYDSYPIMFTMNLILY